MVEAAVVEPPNTLTLSLSGSDYVSSSVTGFTQLGTDSITKWQTLKMMLMM